MWLLYSRECNFTGLTEIYDVVLSQAVSLQISVLSALYLLSTVLKSMVFTQLYNEVSLMRSNSLFKNSSFFPVDAVQSQNYGNCINPL